LAKAGPTPAAPPVTRVTVGLTTISSVVVWSVVVTVWVELVLVVVVVEAAVVVLVELEEVVEELDWAMAAAANRARRAARNFIVVGGLFVLVAYAGVCIWEEEQKGSSSLLCCGCLVAPSYASPFKQLRIHGAILGNQSKNRYIAYLIGQS
jgi:hypothetical protein